MNVVIHSSLSQVSTSGANRIKPRTASHCRVLPPGELNGIIAELLSVHSESVITTAVTVFPYCYITTNIVTKLHRKEVSK